jgi:hypothetical protein
MSSGTHTGHGCAVMRVQTLKGWYRPVRGNRSNQPAAMLTQSSVKGLRKPRYFLLEKPWKMTLKRKNCNHIKTAHFLHTGEVVGSIPTASTIKCPHFVGVRGKHSSLTIAEGIIKSGSRSRSATRMSFSDDHACPVSVTRKATSAGSRLSFWTHLTTARSIPGSR